MRSNFPKAILYFLLLTMLMPGCAKNVDEVLKVKSINSLSESLSEKIPTRLEYASGKDKEIDVGDEIEVTEINGKYNRTGNQKFDWSKFEKTDSIKLSDSEILPDIYVPIFSDDKIISMDSNGIVRATSLESKKEIWISKLLKEKFYHQTLFTKGFIYGGMVLDQDVVFVAYGYNAITALSTKDGESIWTTKLSGVVRLAPLVYKNFLFAYSNSGTIYMLDKETGEIIWIEMYLSEEKNSNAKAFSELPLTIIDDAIFVEAPSGNVIIMKIDNRNKFKINIENSRTQGTGILQGNLLASSSFIDHDDKIFFLSKKGKIATWSKKSEEILWSKYLTIEQNIWIAGNTIYAINLNRELMAVSTNTGHVKWKTPLTTINSNANIQYTSPMMIGDKIVIISSKGVIMLFDPMTGALVQKHYIKTGIYFDPIVYKNSLYLIKSDGVLEIYN